MSYDDWLNKQVLDHYQENDEEETENEDLEYIEYDSEYMSDMWFGKH